MLKPTPLSSSIATRCFEQPAGDSWHSLLQQQQQEGEGDAGGSGGGAAVADPPPAAPEGDADILSFSAPDAGAIADEIIKGRSTPDPGKKGDATSPPPPPPPPKPGEKPKGEGSPVEQLRTQYESTKRELDDLKKKYEAGDPRIAAAIAERDVAKKELDEERKRLGEYEQRLALTNPEVTKELRELDDTWKAEADRFYNAVPDIDHSRAMALVSEYAQLPFGKPEYKAARDAFEAKVNSVLGADEGTTHRKLDKTLDWIERSYQYGKDRPAVEKRVSDNARKLHLESEGKSWTQKKTHVSTLAQKALAVPDDLVKNDPLHPKVVLKNFDAELDPEKVKLIDKDIVEFAELVMAGASPDDDSKYVGMTAQQISESKAKQGERMNRARDHAVDVIINGMRAMRRLPIMMQMLAKYKEKAGKLINGDPPDPGASGDGTGTGDNDLTKIELPPYPEGL
jgi:hypothetical protein